MFTIDSQLSIAITKVKKMLLKTELMQILCSIAILN